MKPSKDFWRGLAACLAAFLLFVPSARADDWIFSPITRFFRDPPTITLPHPDIHLPKLNITPFWTNDLKLGRDAYTHGDYESARGYFLKASDSGNMVADWYLGHMYRLGHGVPVDAAISYSYFNRVAENYNPDEPDPYRLRIEVDAKIRAADYLRLGIPSANLGANPQAAARIYLETATTYGHPRAMFQLGVMNIEGDGMRQNPNQGLKWLVAAARKHSPEAAAYLGDLSAKGRFVPADEVKALMWYTIAAAYENDHENPEIVQRLNQLSFAASNETRIEATANAKLWMDQNPGPPARP